MIAVCHIIDKLRRCSCTRCETLSGSCFAPIFLGPRTIPAVAIIFCLTSPNTFLVVQVFNLDELVFADAMVNLPCQMSIGVISYSYLAVVGHSCRIVVIGIILFISLRPFASNELSVGVPLVCTLTLITIVGIIVRRGCRMSKLHKLVLRIYLTATV